MQSAEIRKKFLEYFVSKGHTIVESASLIPQADPTLLFTNAGMVPFKDAFLGTEKKKFQRAVSIQKCVRAGGKHNDLENVGFTARHHTFFEMLGNFSFGDYFKKEAIGFAWEFTTEVLKLPREKLYVSVYKDDNEAAEIWQKNHGLDSERIFRFGEKDNFWSMGDTGPCGPCSELFYDQGAKVGCGKSTCKVGCDCDRFLEFWNLVFMQYERSSDGKLTALPRPSVDTGAGLERLASILQGVGTNYETDLFVDIINRIKEVAKSRKISIPNNVQSSLQVVADHIRAICFLIQDGILPSNEGRGYVLRRIMRRAIRHGQKIGFQEPFLSEIASYVVQKMAVFYPGLVDKKDSILKAVQNEEIQFLKTLNNGLEILFEELNQQPSGKKLSGSLAFRLMDTFGFPLDLTEMICQERGVQVHKEEFEKELNIQKERSRKSWKGGSSGENADLNLMTDALGEKKTDFLGFQKLENLSSCLAFQRIQDNQSWVVFDQTPFYPEGGGQIGDQGEIFDGDKLIAIVLDTQKNQKGFIVHRVETAREFDLNKKYLLKVSSEKRNAIAKNHTATHLLQAALRNVLGSHVQQSGSLVRDDFLRFDFQHFSALTEDELRKVESEVLQNIWSKATVQCVEMSKEEALKKGAIAFFGDKYGEKVRVVQAGSYSLELCGGTHVGSLEEIGIFKIESESGIAAGTRRIIAKTGASAYYSFREKEDILSLCAHDLKATSVDEVRNKIEKLQTNEKKALKSLESLRTQYYDLIVEKILLDSMTIQSSMIAIFDATDFAKNLDELKLLSERVLAKNNKISCFFACQNPDEKKVFFLASVGNDTAEFLDASKWMKTVLEITEGKGGGKRNLAQGSSPKVHLTHDALNSLKGQLKSYLSP